MGVMVFICVWVTLCCVDVDACVLVFWTKHVFVVYFV